MAEAVEFLRPGVEDVDAVGAQARRVARRSSAIDAIREFLRAAPAFLFDLRAPLTRRRRERAYSSASC